MYYSQDNMILKNIIKYTYLSKYSFENRVSRYIQVLKISIMIGSKYFFKFSLHARAFHVASPKYARILATDGVDEVIINA
jgi:hypothetical protein